MPDLKPSALAREGAADLLVSDRQMHPGRAAEYRSGQMDHSATVQAFAAFEQAIREDVAGQIEGLKRDPDAMPTTTARTMIVMRNEALAEALALVRTPAEGGGE
jgi:hypothetical protein